jgi:hypothetical protein
MVPGTLHERLQKTAALNSLTLAATARILIEQGVKRSEESEKAKG